MALNRTDVDAIQSYWMSHKEELYEKTFAKPMLDSMMMVSAKDKFLLPSATSTSGVQSYQAGHHSKGDVNISARQLSMKPVKFDMTIETRAFDTDYYFSFLNRSGNDPKQFPFQQFVLQMILSQIYEDFAEQMLWQGIELPVIVGAPNNPADTINGFRKLVRDEISAGAVWPYLTGLFDNSTALDGIRNFVKDNLDTPEKRSKTHFIYCSLQTLDAYQENYEDAVGPYKHADEAFSLVKIHGANAYLVPQAGLTGSGLLMARADNLHCGFDGDPWLELDYSSRQLKIEFDWKVGLQFASTLELYCNEWF